MKVAVIHAAIQGSTGNIINALSGDLIKRGHTVIKCYPMSAWNKSIHQKGDIYIGSIITKMIGHILAYYFNGEKISNYFATLLFLRKIQKAKPDIIHLHNIHGSYINLPLLFNYIRKSGIPTIWTFHDCWPLTGHCAHYIYIGCEKWKDECHDCPLYKVYPATWFDNSRYMHKLKKEYFSNIPNLNIVTVSRWLGEQVAKSYLNATSISIINNGIDTETFRPRPVWAIDQEYQLEGKFVIMGLSTAWSDKKGFTEFIKLSELIANDEVIVMVGVSDEMKCLLPKSIIAIDKTASKNELAQLYSRADVVLSLSFAETFGLTVIEGMACGTPAIVYDNTAQRDLVADNTGFCVKTGDIEAVYKSIKIVKNTGKDKFRNKCIEHAKNNYSVQTMCGHYYDLMKELTNNKNNQI